MRPLTQAKPFLLRLSRWVRGRFVRPYRTMVVEDVLPEPVERRVVYILREDGFDEQAALLCPCGCGAVLHMNLLLDDRPCWRVTQNFDGTVTLFPSVRRTKGCKSHFLVMNGRIEWCESAILPQ